ncbi:MAG TPA: DUF4032 domain-containing protein [Ktedonobacterales bacterium]
MWDWAPWPRGPRIGDEPSTEDSGSRQLEGAAGGTLATEPLPGELRAIHIPRADWSRMRRLPWGAPLANWGELGANILSIRKGESRHEVIFVEVGGRRYAIKETSPEAAEREIHVYEQVRPRHVSTLEPVGWVVIGGERIEVGQMGGRPVYMSGDTGYCVTRLAERVLPQSILYRYPFTDANKRLLWNAIAELLVDLHDAGVYWGDPSLANVLIDLSGLRLTAVMADAETAEVVPGSLSEGLRQQDLDSFVESLTWQAEDIRLARGLGEDMQLITESDAFYVISRYAGLRADRNAAHRTHVGGLFDLERRLERLNALGYGVLTLRRLTQRPSRRFRDEEGPRADLPQDELKVATLRPQWYSRRVHDLLGVRVPRPAAERIYRQLYVHKYLLSERAGHDVGMDAAARDWLTHYHEPLMSFLDAYLPTADLARRYETYVAILNHTWSMSLQQRRTVPIEEGAMDYALNAEQLADQAPQESDETSDD